MDDLKYVLVGPDRFRAQVISEACRAAGLVVELLTSDAEGSGPEMGWAEDHRLLVRRSDLDTVLAIVKRSQSNLDPEQSDIAP
jgi:hypothetical protein